MKRRQRNPSRTVFTSLVSAGAAVLVVGFVLSARTKRAINACQMIGGLIQ